MKFLHRLILVAIISPCLLFTGCITTPTAGQSLQERAQEIYDRDGPLIQTGISLVLTGYEQFVVKNPEKRAQLQADLASVVDKLDRATTLALSTTDGTVTPKQLCELLKVKEDYINRLLQSLVPVYSAGYGQLKDADPVSGARLSLQWIKLIVDGIKTGNDFGR